MQFLERALDGQNQWWKYVRVLFAGYIIAGIIGIIPLAAAIAFQTSGDIPAGALVNPAKYGVSANMRLLCMLAPFVIGLLLITRLFRKLHKRSLPEIINGTKAIRWKRFFTGALIWGLLQLICFGVVYLLDPGNFMFSFDASTFFELMLISVLLIPVQASFEEIIFRGYLAQGVSAWTGNRWLALIIPSLLFGLIHSANPEVAEYGFWSVMPSYITFGLAFGLISILDDGIEIAMGAHAINNVLGSLLVTYKASVIQTPALFYQVHVNPLQDIFILLITSSAFVIFLSYRYKWRFRVFAQAVRKDRSVPSKPSEQVLAIDSAPVIAENIDHNGHAE